MAAMLLFRRSSVLLRRFSTNLDRSLLQFNEEVQHALQSNKPVVALESTIITHGGMPYPNNLETALAVESIVRSTGCTPATIAVMDGKLKVGLSQNELATLAKIGPHALKTSRRDLAHVLSNRKLVGATTVAGTMIVAHLAGIRVFVTGGIGGVHRGGQDSLDVSADLTELGRTPVTVVCAGVKSILDIGRTLEYLETQGVTVATLGPTREFPSFYTASSGFLSPIASNDVEELAQLLYAHKRMALDSGIVVAVPIPEAYAAKQVEQAIQTALAEAQHRGVTGPAVTPFVLQAVNQLTGGLALKANIALIKHNALRGGQLAFAAAALEAAALRSTPSTTPSTPASSSSSTSTLSLSSHNKTPQPLVVGGAVRDIISSVHPSINLVPRSSNPGNVRFSWGGVGRNITEALGRFGAKPTLVTAITEDDFGNELLRNFNELGLGTQGFMKQSSQENVTAVYNAFLDGSGEMQVAVADMRIFDKLTVPAIKHKVNKEEIKRSSFVVIDGNIPVETMRYIGECCDSTPLVFEPTSVAKSIRILDARVIPALITPNREELQAMVLHQLTSTKSGSSEILSLIQLLSHPRAMFDGSLVAECCSVLLQQFPMILVKLDADGVLFGQRLGFQTSVRRFLPKTKPTDIRNVTGAGDCMVAAFALAHFQYGAPVEEAINIAFQAAHTSLRSDHAVAHELSPKLFEHLHQ